MELPSQEKFPTTGKKNSWSSTEPRWSFSLPPLQGVTQSNVYWMVGRWILVKTFGEGEQELRTDLHVKTQLFLSFNSHFPRLRTYRSRRHCPCQNDRFQERKERKEKLRADFQQAPAPHRDLLECQNSKLTAQHRYLGKSSQALSSAGLYPGISFEILL